MGYYYKAEPENAVPAKSWATPKTHVPGSPVKERGHRLYTPELGRWASRDPIGERGGFNLFASCCNSAIILVDPLGKNPFVKVAGRCAAQVLTDKMKEAFGKKLARADFGIAMQNDCASNGEACEEKRSILLPKYVKEFLKTDSAVLSFSGCVIEEATKLFLGALYDDIVKGKKLPDWIDPESDIGKKLKEAGERGADAAADEFKKWVNGATFDESVYLEYWASDKNCRLNWAVTYNYWFSMPGLLVEDKYFGKKTILDSGSQPYEELGKKLRMLCGICPCEAKK